ncbi:MAG: HPr family phosphocarrier protein, partial [Kiloniellaceae bacterium]
MKETVAQARVTIVNQRGLHARAAAKFVKLAEAFDAEVTVVKNGIEVSGASIMGLMMLAAAPGNELDLRATGPGARAAGAAVAARVAPPFA